MKDIFLALICYGKVNTYFITLQYFILNNVTNAVFIPE